ncbi:hypothetical protein POTOM_019724 [Populus tomentosa]|uniref:RNA-directed DNA polymerase n=1 Tax=Populus tomentosa TaxID=118781 RepID=A0A8X7ZSF3_POPTO|nr:hypothetical protein POTOM_019724 [Populus tomentosa]
MTIQRQALISRIKSNLEDKIPTWEELETEEGWDLLLNDSTSLCLENNDSQQLSDKEIDDFLENDTLPLCKVEETIDLSQVVWTDLTTIPQEKILDLGRVARQTRTHVNSIYIRGTLSFSGYRKFNVDCYVDTGASMCLANKNIIPPQFWTKTPNPIYAKLADDTIHTLDVVAERIEILIQDKIFIIPTLYQTESRYDILLGNNFCRLYEPFAQWGKIIIFHHEGQTVVCPKITKAYHRGQPGFLDSQRHGSNSKIPEPENIVQNLDFDQKSLGESINILTPVEDFLLNLMSISTIEDKLKNVCSDNPLDNNISKYRFRAHIELVDKSTKIKVPPMQYTAPDRDEFAKQIQELLDAGLIEPSKSPHFSPAFLVNKHSEQKRGKRRMVINYKKLNDHTIGDGYLLPRKDELLDHIRGKKLFSSFDCKSGFWQVAQIRQPLQAKLKKDTVWQWSKEDTDYVDKIKKAIKHLPPVHHPGPDEPLIIETDASDKYWGGILKSQPEEGPELICGYASGTFKPAEQNYHSNEKELLALINTIKRFSVYLIPDPTNKEDLSGGNFGCSTLT